MRKQQNENIRQIHELQQLLDEQYLRLQISLRENQNIRLKVFSLTGNRVSEDIIMESISLKKIVIANGRLLPQQEMLNLNEENYDVVLNCINCKLLARKDPDHQTKLDKCNFNNVGRNRLKLLRRWLENPRLPICEETIPQVFGDVASMTPGALARTILELRRCLWNGPYILTDSIWGESISHTGSVYMLNNKYKYLVMRYKI